MYALLASCLSNLKQLAVGIIMYAQDYDEMYTPYAPWAWGTPVVQATAGMPGAVYQTSNGASTGYYVMWMDLVYPYVKNTQIFACPSGQQYQANCLEWVKAGGRGEYLTSNDPAQVT